MLLELILVKNFNKMGDLFRDDSPTRCHIERFSGCGTAGDVSFFVGWNLKLIEYIIFSIKTYLKNISKKYAL